MKKIFASLFVTGALALNMFGATATITVTNTQMAAFPLALPNGGTLLSLIVVNTNSGVGSAAVYDLSTNVLTFTNASYNTIVSYATNYITTWTNYYGYTNNITNLALVDITNTVAAATNTFKPIVTAAIGANASLSFAFLNQLFTRGLWVTNTGGTNLTLTATYTQ